jgi:hypothetical protein
MNFRLKGKHSVILMSLRPNAPYADRIEENGRVLIYEGHDAPYDKFSNPKLVDQPMHIGNQLTQNGLFFNAAMKHKQNDETPELVRVYEKIKSGIWVYNGLFKLIDAWPEESNARKVFKFRLELIDEKEPEIEEITQLDHTRLIPSSVKLEVWKRDKGRCVKCGSTTNLHFDHVLPFSKGGTSLKVENIQILCAKHNLKKHDKIE